MYSNSFKSKLFSQCFIYCIQTLENTNKFVRIENDLSNEIPELDTASFWYVSETDVYFFILGIMVYLL